MHCYNRESSTQPGVDKDGEAGLATHWTGRKAQPRLPTGTYGKPKWIVNTSHRPFSSWTFSFFQTHLHGGWGPNGAKKAPKCWQTAVKTTLFFCQTHLFLSILRKEFLSTITTTKKSYAEVRTCKHKRDTWYLRQRGLLSGAFSEASDHLLLTLQFFIAFTQQTLVTTLHCFLSLIHFIA